MTMVTASTALTIFIMNIHHCGPEARPVPSWAERFILNYLARVCFVYEAGENCLGAAAKQRPPPPQPDAKRRSWDVNGQVWAGRLVEEEGDGESAKLRRDLTTQTDWKEDMFVTVDDSEQEGAAGGGGEKKGLGGVVGGPGEEVPVRTPCQHLGLCRNVEYIANSYQDQRAGQLRVGEWRKVAKVMDRFFMWLFFVMVFFMSILILGKAI